MTQARKLFSKNLKKFRKRNKLTQEQLADKLGINARYIQLLEGSNCPNVKIDTLADIAKVLGVKMADLLEG